MATIKLNPVSIDDLVQENSTVIVDFWAPWCGPCRAQGPILEQLSEERTDVVVAKVNIDEHPDFAQDNQINSIPTIWIFKEGKKTYDAPGVLTPSQLEELL